MIRALHSMVKANGVIGKKRMLAMLQATIDVATSESTARVLLRRSGRKQQKQKAIIVNLNKGKRKRANLQDGFAHHLTSQQDLDTLAEEAKQAEKDAASKKAKAAERKRKKDSSAAAPTLAPCTAGGGGPPAKRLPMPAAPRSAPTTAAAVVATPIPTPNSHAAPGVVVITEDDTEVIEIFDHRSSRPRPS
jgi:hypothetical protein